MRLAQSAKVPGERPRIRSTSGLMANALREPRVMDREGARLLARLDSLEVA
ncbi:hypothetical protein [Micromonospora sp. NPDC005367]|uniref:hypothetical protein n=1 Tax=Micromonospora sp. NPDC005367 TaxID=3155590 RepID=UPI0033BF995D